MNNRFKRFLASLMAVVLLLGMLPTAAFADGIDTPVPTEETTSPPAEESPAETAEEPTGEPVGDCEENTASAPIFQFDGYKTLDDFGISNASAFSLRRSSASSGYLNPQTIRPSSDSYGYRWICNRRGYRYPFTASFTLDENYMPQNSVYIAIANYDCDELGNGYSCEYDQVYINGHCVGVLTGNDNTSNTTLLKVDRSYLKAGTNEITIRVGIRIGEYGSQRWGDPVGTVHADDPYSQWWLRVDDIQVLCDGGSAEGRPDVFRVNLTNAELSGNQVNCYVTTLVEDSQSRRFSLEYALYDWSCEESETYGQIIDDDFATIYDGNYSHEGTLAIPLNSMSGTYTAVVYLKVKENGKDTILAYDEESFEYETGIVPAFDIQNLTATPATLEWTADPVVINLSADIDVEAGLTDLVFCITDAYQTTASVDENGHVTGTLVLPENGFYTVELRYIKDGKPYKKTTTIEINNIVDALDGIVLNVKQDDLVVEDAFAFTWNEVAGADHYLLSLYDITDTDAGTAVFTQTRIESDAGNRFAAELTAGRRYRVWICAVPGGLDQTSPLCSTCCVEFDYKTVPAFAVKFDGNGNQGASGTLRWTVPTSRNGIVVTPDGYIVNVYRNDANGPVQVFHAETDGTATSLTIDGSTAFADSGYYSITVYATMYESWGKSIHAVAELDPVYPVGIGKILQAGFYSAGSYVTGSGFGFRSTDTFWVTTSMATEEVYLYGNGKALNNGKPLTADSSEILADNTRRYKVKLSLGEGIYTISFRTKDGVSEATVTFCSINDISDRTMYPASSQVSLRTWPSTWNTSAGLLPWDATVMVRGEIDVSGKEGYYYITYNGRHYFVNKQDLSDTSLEKQFREFVKGVSETYYRSSYDYNKYYYLASDVKYSWDKKLSNRNDAYSTYDEDSQYNIQLIQQMLIDGIQEKADTVTHLDLSYYVDGQALNPITGKWEENAKALKMQEQYNADLDAAIEKALDEWGMSLINTTADLILTRLQVGEKSPWYSVVDACTAVATDYAKAKTEALHANITADIQNAYRDMMIQSIVDMYDNIDMQVNADNRALLAELNAKTNLSSDEKLLRDELQKLINALDKEKAAAHGEIEKVCADAAETLAEEMGLKLMDKRTEAEIDAYIAREVFGSVCTNTLKTLVDSALDQYLDGLSSKSEVKEFIAKQIETIVLTYVEALIDECLSDGSFSMEEMCAAIKNKFLNQDFLKEVLALAYSNLVSDDNKLSFSPDLEKQLKEIASDLNKATEQERYARQKLEKGIKGNYKVEKRQAVLTQKMKETAELAEKKVDCEKQLKNAKLSSPQIVKDILDVAKNTFNVVETTVGIGDMADNEVFYAYCANYMVHAMETAEIKRDSLFTTTYKQMADPSYIDTAPIEELKAFVNRVYSVYEQDMLGHSTYTTLAAGFHYSDSGEKLNDWIADKEQWQASTKEKLGNWNWVTYATGLQALYAATAYLGGISQSEYLEAVNKKHIDVAKSGIWNGFYFDSNIRNGFPSVAFAEDQYDVIADYANEVELPDKFKALNE